MSPNQQSCVSRKSRDNTWSYQAHMRVSEDTSVLTVNVSHSNKKKGHMHTHTKMGRKYLLDNKRYECFLRLGSENKSVWKISNSTPASKQFQMFLFLQLNSCYPKKLWREHEWESKGEEGDYIRLFLQIKLITVTVIYHFFFVLNGTALIFITVVLP